MRRNQYFAGFVAAFLLAVPAASFAQTDTEIRSQIAALIQQVATLLWQVSELQAATNATPQAAAVSCQALASSYADGSVTDACLVNRFLPCNESSPRAEVKCLAGQWRATQTPPATPPGETTAGCMPMSGDNATSGHNFCGDLHCPDNSPEKRYWCRGGQSPAAWYSSSLPCSGLSCLI